MGGAACAPCSAADPPPPPPPVAGAVIGLGVGAGVPGRQGKPSFLTRRVLSGWVGRALWGEPRGEAHSESWRVVWKAAGAATGSSLTWFCLYLVGSGVSARPGAEGEGTGAALPYADGRQQKPQLHGQILRAAGDRRVGGWATLPTGCWLLAREGTAVCRTPACPVSAFKLEDPTEHFPLSTLSTCLALSVPCLLAVLPCGFAGRNSQEPRRLCSRETLHTGQGRTGHGQHGAAPENSGSQI